VLESQVGAEEIGDNTSLGAADQTVGVSRNGAWLRGVLVGPYALEPDGCADMASVGTVEPAVGVSRNGAWLRGTISAGCNVGTVTGVSESLSVLVGFDEFSEV